MRKETKTVTIELEEDLKLPGTDIILEKGDRIQVQEATLNKSSIGLAISESSLKRSDIIIAIEDVIDRSYTEDQVTTDEKFEVMNTLADQILNDPKYSNMNKVMLDLPNLVRTYVASTVGYF